MHSGILISQSDGRPMYLQIKEQVKQRVAVGDWPPGEEIPSIRQLAVDLSVSVITVKRAYLELEREGVILTQQGKASIVAPNPDLSQQLYDAEFAGHIEEAVRLGMLLGMNEEKIVGKLRDAVERQEEARLARETV